MDAVRHIPTRSHEATSRSDAPCSSNRSEGSQKWEYEILVDGECPLCAKEAALLRKMDRGRGRLRITDITDPSFDATAYGTTFQEVMGTIHGRSSDGSIHTGVEVFRRSYRAVGWGWLLAWTRLPILRTVSDGVYRFFARHRLRLTGRRNACATDRCRV